MADFEKFELFDHIKNLTYKKVEYNEDNEMQVKSYPPYMINRMFSMSKFHIFDVNKVNRMNIDISPEQNYNYYFYLLPKRSIYNKYISIKNGSMSEELECICKYYQVGKKEAMEYCKLLTEAQRKEIISKYK
jgi:hypothetical protein